jgi:hypothetical protein
MSTFNPEAFLDATITEPSTKRPPLPAGRDFVGIIGETKSRSWQGKKDPTQSGIVIDVPVTIDLTAYPDLGEAYKGAKQVVLTDGIMLDLTEGGSIDNGPGKNGKLRRYREALNMNKAGDAFSFRAMSGRQIKVKVSHREYGGELFDQIESVARA